MASPAVEQIRDQFFAYYRINPDAPAPPQYDIPTLVGLWENFLYARGSGESVEPVVGYGSSNPAPSGNPSGTLLVQPQAQPGGWFAPPRPGQPIAPTATGPSAIRTSATPSGGL